MQPMLFNAPTPPGPPKGIDFRCATFQEIAATIDEPVAMVVSDPPWLYDNTIGQASPALHYGGLEMPEIVEHLTIAAGLSSRLLLWHTWPKMAGDWTMELPKWGRPVTGGAWFKSDPEDSGHYGPGYHWAGCSEPVLIYTRPGSHTDRSQPLRNAWHSKPGPHSRKPVGWMRQWLRRWTKPGDLVLDMYAGLGSVAEACILENRRYIGAEPDEDRHRRALGLLAQVRTP